MKVLALKYLMMSICLLFLSCSSKIEDQKAIPNFVLIMADDLGYGDLSAYGNTTIQTPNIDFLAAEGVKFMDFHSNGAVCSPTRAALMTGKYQQRTGVEGVVTAKSHRKVGMSLDEITLADELKQYNYNCAMYGKWHLGYAEEFNPSLQGFDDFVGFVSGNVDYHGHIDQEGYLDWWKNTNLDNEAGYTTDLITDYGVKFIQANDPKKTNKPFFLYLAHEAPHYPYQRRVDEVLREVGKPGSTPVDADSIPAIYKEMVEVMDLGVGKIIKALKATGNYENTMIIFISDNGASRNGSNGELRGFKGGVYEGGSRVPAIISYVDQIGKGQINDQTVLSMDLLPTMLDFIGQQPAAKDIDGISLKNNLLHQTELPERDVFFAFKNKSFIRSGKWKMVCKKEADHNKLELYDLSVDLPESTDVAKEHPDLLNELSSKLNRWEEEVRKGVEVVSQ